MKLKKYMTDEEHEAIARRLLAAIHEAEELGKLVVHTYGTSSRLGKMAERLFMTGKRTDLQEFRSLLDSAWFHERPDAESKTTPYYGSREK